MGARESLAGRKPRDVPFSISRDLARIGAGCGLAAAVPLPGYRIVIQPGLIEKRNPRRVFYS